MPLPFFRCRRNYDNTRRIMRSNHALPGALHDTLNDHVNKTPNPILDALHSVDAIVTRPVDEQRLLENLNLLHPHRPQRPPP